MMTFAAALLFALQDEARLKDAWPKLADAWKAVDAYKAPAGGSELDDEFLKTAGKLRDAFEAAGLFTEEGEYLPMALKAFVKARGRALAPSGGNDFFRGGRVIRRVRVAGMGGGAPGQPEGAPSVESDPMGAFMASLQKLRNLKQGGLDDEDNVQDELVTARKALKALGITADDTPPALRRRIFTLIRSLALGEAFPEPAKATEEQAKQFRALIADLGHESIENRDKASKELLRAGEASLPLVREALKAGDAEVVARARQLLGVGHAPWKAARVQQNGEVFDILIEAPVAPAPAK
jgi:hypothetical protein